MTDAWLESQTSALKNKPFRDITRSRGGIAAHLTRKLNDARDFCIVNNEMLTREEQSVRDIVGHLGKIDEAFQRVSRLNDWVISLFPEEKRSESNPDWIRTFKYMEYAQEPFLQNRFNLFKLLFAIYESEEEGATLQRAAPCARDFRTIRPPAGKLRPAPTTERPLTEAQIPGEISDNGEGEEEEGEDPIIGFTEDGSPITDPNATVIPHPRGGNGAGGVQSSAAASANAVDEGIGEGRQRPRPPGFPSLAAAPAPGTDNNDFITSTLRGPVTFTQKPFTPFAGRDIFSEFRGQQNDDNQSSGPMANFRGSNLAPGNPWTPHPFGIGSTNIQSSGQNDMAKVIQMFSQSLSTGFSASAMIPEKWDGNPETFETFMMNWLQVDSCMSAMSIPGAFKYAQLLKCVTSTAKLYISNLNPTSNDSYEFALNLLFGAYSARKTTLKNSIKHLINMKPCDGSFNGRLKFHASLVNYKTSLNSFNAKPHHVLFGFEESILTSKMDEELRRGWLRHVEKITCCCWCCCWCCCCSRCCCCCLSLLLEVDSGSDMKPPSRSLSYLEKESWSWITFFRRNV